MSPLALVVADTHIPRRARSLPRGLNPYLERADLVLHAGDLMDPVLLGELAAYAPVEAVRGNLDPPGLPETLEFGFGGARVAMIHDSGPKRGRRPRRGRASPGREETRSELQYRNYLLYRFFFEKKKNQSHD